MTTMQALAGGTGLVYLVGAFWFLFLERKESFLFWRVVSTIFSPLTVPLLAVVGILLISIEKIFSRQPKVEKKKVVEAKE